MARCGTGLCLCLLSFLLIGPHLTAADEDPSALRKALLEAWGRQDALECQYHAAEKEDAGGAASDIRLHKAGRALALEVDWRSGDPSTTTRFLFNGRCSVVESGETRVVALGFDAHDRRWAALESATRRLAKEWGLKPPDPWPRRSVALTLALAHQPDGTVNLEAGLSDGEHPTPSWLAEDTWRDARVRADDQGVVHVERDGSRILIERSTGVLIEFSARRRTDGVDVRLRRVPVTEDGGNFANWIAAQGPPDAVATNQDFENQGRLIYLLRPLLWLLDRSRAGSLDRRRLRDGIARIVEIAFDDALGRAMVMGLVLRAWPFTSAVDPDAPFFQEAAARAQAAAYAKRWWALGRCLRSIPGAEASTKTNQLVDEPWVLLDEVGQAYLSKALQRGFSLERLRREVLSAFRGLRRTVREYAWTTDGVPGDPWRGARVGLYVDEGVVGGRLAAPGHRTSEFSIGPERVRYVDPEGVEVVTFGTRMGHGRAVRLRDICSRVHYAEAPGTVADIPEQVMSPSLAIAVDEGRPVPHVMPYASYSGVPDWLDPATWIRLSLQPGEGPTLVLRGATTDLEIERKTGLPVRVQMQLSGGGRGRLESVPARETAFDWRDRLARHARAAVNDTGWAWAAASLRAQFAAAAAWLCRSHGGAAPTPALRQSAKDLVAATFEGKLLQYMATSSLQDVKAKVLQHKYEIDAPGVVEFSSTWAKSTVDGLMGSVEPQVARRVLERTGVVHDGELLRVLASELRGLLRRTMEAEVWNLVQGGAGRPK